jgi:hypothetical protein
MKAQSLQYILLGFEMVVFGAVSPFMMVLGVIKISFWLSMLAYGASVIGLFIGVFGAFEISKDELDP